MKKYARRKNNALISNHPDFPFLLGVLLHFDDPSLKLTDCYFIHPEWLSQMMAQVVTVKEINPFVDENGVLNRESLPILFKGGNFPEAFIDSYLRYMNVLMYF